MPVAARIRLLKKTLGWTASRLPNPRAAVSWTWLVLAAYAQLWLARHLATDPRRLVAQCPGGQVYPPSTSQETDTLIAT